MVIPALPGGSTTNWCVMSMLVAGVAAFSGGVGEHSWEGEGEEEEGESCGRDLQQPSALKILMPSEVANVMKKTDTKILMGKGGDSNS